MTAPDVEPDRTRPRPPAPGGAPIPSVQIDVGGAPFLFPQTTEPRVAEVLRGKYNHPSLPDHPTVRRIVDVRAGVGDFACWAWNRWRNAWIECYEPDVDLVMFLRHNLPPGAAVHPGDVTDPQTMAALPSCDVLRLDVGGGEADLLRAYPHRPAIVCFDWHSQQDRLEMEGTLSSWGLRCFRITFHHTDLGHQVWVRSRATWNPARMRYELP